MAGAIRLYVHLTWSGQTAARLREQGVTVPWPAQQLLTITTPQPPMHVEDIASWIEAQVEGLYYRAMQGQDEGQAQVMSIMGSRCGELALDVWGDPAFQHLKDGDTVVVVCEFVSVAMQTKLSDEELDRIRADLRFENCDRVVCNIGPRWVSGTVVGTAVAGDNELFPYLVKTDPLPGLPGRTISVPMDSDQICVQEVCFDPSTQLRLVQAAARVVKDPARAKLRFGVGDPVVVRVRNSAEDGLERWVTGTVSSTWPKLDGEAKWEVEDVSGEFPDTVPYQVALSSGGSVYCHHDHFTLIRREGLEPQTRVTGISKRMELVKAADGGLEKIDHQTERRKRVIEEPESGDSD